MANRILIQVDPAMMGEGTLPPQAIQLLESAGATQIRASHPELPGVFTALIPAEANSEALISNLRRLPKILHAEVDQFRCTL